jgi:hypothetical protein
MFHFLSVFLCSVDKNRLLVCHRILLRLHPATDILHSWAAER